MQFMCSLSAATCNLQVISCKIVQSCNYMQKGNYVQSCNYVQLRIVACKASGYRFLKSCLGLGGLKIIFTKFFIV